MSNIPYRDRLPKRGGAFEMAGLAAHKSITSETTRTGFVLQILTCKKSGFRVETINFGTLDSMGFSYCCFTAEKAFRLHTQRHERGMQDIASSQSRNEKEQRYAGAIVAFDEDGDEVYLSVSGLNQWCDEGLAYCMAKQFGLQVSPEYRKLNEHLPTIERCMRDALS